MRTYLDVATITDSKSLDGRLVAKAGAGLPFLLQEGMQVWIVPPVTDAPRNVTVNMVAPFQKSDCLSEAIISFNEITDVSAAKAIIGCHCLVEECLMEDMDGYEQIAASAGAYNGWRFADKSSGLEGIVVDAQTLAGQVLLSVRVDGKDDEHLVPLADELVVEIDELARLITMNCPSGLFNL